MRKVAAAAPVAPTDVSMSDSESSEEEDLLSSSGSHPPPPPPQIPPTVARPEDLDVDCEDSPLDPPGLPEPVKIPTNHEVLDAKHALKEGMKNVPTPTKANAFCPKLWEFSFSRFSRFPNLRSSVDIFMAPPCLGSCFGEVFGCQNAFSAPVPRSVCRSVCLVGGVTFLLRPEEMV